MKSFDYLLLMKCKKKKVVWSSSSNRERSVIEFLIFFRNVDFLSRKNSKRDSCLARLNNNRQRVFLLSLSLLTWLNWTSQISLKIAFIASHKWWTKFTLCPPKTERKDLTHYNYECKKIPTNVREMSTMQYFWTLHRRHVSE